MAFHTGSCTCNDCEVGSTRRLMCNTCSSTFASLTEYDQSFEATSPLRFAAGHGYCATAEACAKTRLLIRHSVRKPFVCRLTCARSPCEEIGASVAASHRCHRIRHSK